MKKIVCIVVSLCTATLACSGEDPIPGKRGRAVAPRLTGASWARCCVRPAEVRKSCGEKDAPGLLESAHGDCLDTAITVLERRASRDLAAAYFLRWQRNDSPMDLLRALRTAEDELRRDPRSREALFNKALAQEHLGLVDEAMNSWNRLDAIEDSDWAKEGAEHRKQLFAGVERNRRWQTDLEAALRRRDRGALSRLTKPSPSAVMRHFEISDLFDSVQASLLASVLAETGDRYAQDVLDAMARTKDRDALKRGIEEFQRVPNPDYARAALLLERARNPLSLSARYGVAAAGFSGGRKSLEQLDAIRVPPGYRDLAARRQMLRGNALEYEGRYLDALGTYEAAMRFAGDDASAKAAILLRRSNNYLALGNSKSALRDAIDALALLPGVPRPMDQFRVYETAALAMEKLGELQVALQYRNAALAAVSQPPVSPKHLSGVLSRRAGILAALGWRKEAVRDLEEAADLAESIAEVSERELLKMRIHEIEGQMLLDTNPKAAVDKFTAAIALAPAQDSSHRAVLRYKRAIARRAAGDPEAEEDILAALRILRTEAEALLKSSERGKFEDLWTDYFARFDAMQRDLIVSRINANDMDGAFVHAEQARAFEPMHLLLQTGPAPPGFVRIETVSDLQRNRARLPEDTVVLQYLVLADKTYVWILTRNALRLWLLPVRHNTIERWVEEAHDAARSGQWPRVQSAMHTAYASLVEPALNDAPGRTRIVIVPDRPMHALPFAALNDSKGVYLIQRASIAVAGSTSLYLYALHRDGELASNGNPSVLIVAEPATDPRLELRPLPGARAEARTLKSILYKDAEILLGADATSRRFLAAAKNATIIHFAGHGIANAAMPWMSMLALAPEGTDRGELTAKKLLTEVRDLSGTRFIVLAACSTASGGSVGPEGVAPLVRPLLAARVPAVVGTVADVSDATVKDLLVSLHCHYRNGDDVAVALQNAQRVMLRKNNSAGPWVLFQVVGYAGSPYPRPAPSEETSELFPCQNLLYRPDGLHSQ